MFHSAITESRMIILYLQAAIYYDKASDARQLIGDINQRILYDKHFFQSSFHEKVLPFSHVFIFHFQRDNFIKFLKIITVNFYSCE